MKRWTPVVITWHDAHGGGEWMDERDLKHAPVTVIEVGLLYKRDAIGITTVKARMANGIIHGQSFIPAANIVEVKKLEEA